MLPLMFEVHDTSRKDSWYGADLELLMSAFFFFFSADSADNLADTVCLRARWPDWYPPHSWEKNP